MRVVQVAYAELPAIESLRSLEQAVQYQSSVTTCRMEISYNVLSQLLARMLFGCLICKHQKQRDPQCKDITRDLCATRCWNYCAKFKPSNSGRESLWVACRHHDKHGQCDTAKHAPVAAMMKASDCVKFSLCLVWCMIL